MKVKIKHIPCNSLCKISFKESPTRGSWAEVKCLACGVKEKLSGWQNEECILDINYHITKFKYEES